MAPDAVSPWPQATNRWLIWVEALVIAAIGIAGIVESIRVVHYRMPGAIVDMLGPGYYIAFVSVGLLVSGAVYVFRHRHDELPPEPPKEIKTRLIGTYAAYAAYALLIYLVGFGIATLLFFLMIFRVFGIRSWRTIVALSIVLGLIWHLGFGKLADMSFPAGILF
ncbi:MAG: tripartite tricarboxylate transporter TctB family protein [Hyphomicrobiaceae bacterium]|nr:tripartite tricarboxylate transporter TctB family protein [Hyphomicrobiaceae bacterium]